MKRRVFAVVIMVMIFLVSGLNENPDKQIDGYINKDSYYPGEIIKVYVSASMTYNLNVYKYSNEIIGPYYSEINKNPELQNNTDKDYREGCDWKLKHQIVILENWDSGIYMIKLSDLQNKEIKYIPFIIKDQEMEDIVFLASTNTWQAYNSWGGAGYYVNNHDDNASFAPIISFNRPNNIINPESKNLHTANMDILTIGWLEENNRLYSVISDYDLHENKTILNNSKILILGAHPEYWSFEMRENLNNFLKRGGNLIYLGGNGIYWKVTYDDDGTLMEVRKDSANHTQTGEPGGKWRNLYDNNGIEMNEAVFLGIAYTRDGYNTYAPYKVYNSTHWIYNNTNLKDGDLMGISGLFDKNNDGAGDGASGWETDKVNEFSPTNLTILGIGENEEGGANMVYFEKDNGNVFSVGSITFVQSLVIDEDLSMMLNNVLDMWLL